MGLGRSTGRMKIISINPCTEEIVAEFRQMTPDEVDGEVRKSRRSFSAMGESFRCRADSVYSEACGQSPCG